MKGSFLMLSSWKDIAVLTQADDAGELAVRAAARLAARHEAALTGLCALTHARGAPADDFVRGAGMGDVIANRRAADATSGKVVGARFAEIIEPFLERSDLRIGWWDGEGEHAAITALHCDLIVLGHSPLTRLPSTWSAEALLFGHGVPLLLMPERAPEPVGDQILIAWNGSREARRAVNDAMPFLSRASAVTILEVDDGGDVAPISGPGAAETVRHLACHGVTARTRQVRSGGREIAACIRAAAAEMDCDLIVLGGYSHARTAERLFGGVTRSLLAECAAPLFLAR